MVSSRQGGRPTKNSLHHTTPWPFSVSSYALRSTGGPSHIPANDGFATTGSRDTHSGISRRHGYPQPHVERTFAPHTHSSLENEGRQPHNQTQEVPIWNAQLYYLGHIMGDGKVKPEPTGCCENISDFQEASEGLPWFNRKFIPEFATTAAPLTDLTRKNSLNRVVWTDDCTRAFEKLKETLCTAPVLYSPDFMKPFALESRSAKLIPTVPITDRGQTLGRQGSSPPDPREEYPGHRHTGVLVFFRRRLKPPRYVWSSCSSEEKKPIMIKYCQVQWNRFKNHLKNISRVELSEAEFDVPNTKMLPCKSS